MITVFYCFVKIRANLLMYLNVYLCSCVSGYMHLCVHGDQKKALELSELELQLFVGLLIYHMIAGPKQQEPSTMYVFSISLVNTIEVGSKRGLLLYGKQIHLKPGINILVTMKHYKDYCKRFKSFKNSKTVGFEARRPVLYTLCLIFFCFHSVTN